MNKQKLQERLGLVQDPDVPLIGMVTHLIAHKGLGFGEKESLDQLMWESNTERSDARLRRLGIRMFLPGNAGSKYPGRLVA